MFEESEKISVLLVSVLRNAVFMPSPGNHRSNGAALVNQTSHHSLRVSTHLPNTSHCFLNLLSIQGPSRTAVTAPREYIRFSEEATRKKGRCDVLFKHLNLRAAYRNLKDALPDAGNQEATRPILLDRGGSYSTRNFLTTRHLTFSFLTCITAT